MNSLRFLPLLVVLALLAGCQTEQTEPSFTKLRVTNHRGEFVADWTARGGISPTERGYRITAVERLSAPPYAKLTRYPDGWRTNVVGPHIKHWACPKPQWLAEWEGDPWPVAEPPFVSTVSDKR